MWNVLCGFRMDELDGDSYYEVSTDFCPHLVQSISVLCSQYLEWPSNVKLTSHILAQNNATKMFITVPDGPVAYQ